MTVKIGHFLGEKKLMEEQSLNSINSLPVILIMTSILRYVRLFQTRLIVISLFYVKADTSRVVWAYHSRDPSSEEELMSLQHEQMGSASLNLLGGLNEDRVEESSDSFTILNDDVRKRTVFTHPMALFQSHS